MNSEDLQSTKPRSGLKVENWSSWCNYYSCCHPCSSSSSSVYDYLDFRLKDRRDQHDFWGLQKYSSMEDPTFSLVLTRRQWTETPTVSNEEKRRPVIHWTFPRQGLELAHGSFCKWNRMFLSNPQDMSKTKEGTQQNSLSRYQTWKHQKWPLHHLPQLINFIGVPYDDSRLYGPSFYPSFSSPGSLECTCASYGKFAWSRKQWSSVAWWEGVR